jgi:hypothetical protein
MKYKITRELKKSEYRWLDQDIPKGTVVFSYEGCTYGCISDRGQAVTLKENTNPFYEVPKDALENI